MYRFITHRLSAGLFVLLFQVTATCAQKGVQLLNTSLSKPHEAVMYTGVFNHIVVKGDVPGKHLLLERSGGPLEMRAGTAIRTKLFYKEPGTDTLRLYAGDSLIIEKIYTIRTLGPAAASLKNNRDSLVSTEAILEANELEVYFVNSLYKPIPANRGCTVEIYNAQQKKVISLRLADKIFTDEFRKELMKAGSGFRIVFSNINCLLNQKTIPDIKPLSLYIK